MRMKWNIEWHIRAIASPDDVIGTSRISRALSMKLRICSQTSSGQSEGTRFADLRAHQSPTLVVNGIHDEMIPCRVATPACAHRGRAEGECCCNLLQRDSLRSLQLDHPLSIPPVEKPFGRGATNILGGDHGES
jgi:hypothetical protein